MNTENLFKRPKKRSFIETNVIHNHATNRQKYEINQLSDLKRIKIPLLDGGDQRKTKEFIKYLKSVYNFLSVEYLMKKKVLSKNEKEIISGYCSELDIYRTYTMHITHHKRYRNSNSKNSPGTLMWLLQCTCLYVGKELWNKSKLYKRWQRLWKQNAHKWQEMCVLIGNEGKHITNVKYFFQLDMMGFQFLLYNTSAHLHSIDVKQVHTITWFKFLNELCSIFVVESIPNERMNCKRWCSINNGSGNENKKFIVNAKFLNETEAHLFFNIKTLIRVHRFNELEWNTFNIERNLFRVIAILFERGRKKRDARKDSELISWADLRDKPHIKDKVKFHIPKALFTSQSYMQFYQGWIKKHIGMYNNNQQMKRIMCSFIRHELATPGRMEHFYIETDKEENIKIASKPYQDIGDKDVMASKLGPDHVMQNIELRTSKCNIYMLYLNTIEESSRIEARKRESERTGSEEEYFSYVYHQLVPDAIVFALIEQFVMSNFNKSWARYFYVDWTNYNKEFINYIHGRYVNLEHIITGKPIVISLKPGQYGVYFKEILWKAGNFRQALYIWIYLVHSAYKGEIIGFNFWNSMTKVIFSDNIIAVED